MPFANYDDFESCVRVNSDKDNPEAYCATIKRQVEGQSEEFDDVDLDVLLETADAHAEELLAEFLQTAIAEQEGDVGDPSQEQLDRLAVDVFRITQAEDDDMTLDSDLMGVGVDFPNAGVYVDWHIDAWPDDEQLAEPHVSDYGSIEDLEQATGGVVEHLETVETADAAEVNDDVDQQAVISGLSQEAMEDIGRRYNVDVAAVDGEGDAAPTDHKSQSE